MVRRETSEVKLRKRFDICGLILRRQCVNEEEKTLKRKIVIEEVNRSIYMYLHIFH
jgi:hypothetical protein